MPITSATAACCAGPNRPDPTPASAEAARNHTRSWVKPMPAVAIPATTRPHIIRGLRPRLSASRPEKVSAAALPAAKTASASPAASGPEPKAAAANRGTVAIRTPNVAHPLAKLEKSADLYAPVARASPKPMSGALCPWPVEPRRWWLSWVCTTTAATTRAAA
ncbi:hypothetical protein ARTHROSP310_04680 [Arthrobacter sp. AD-310]